MGGAEGVGSTWCIVPVRLHLQGLYGPLSMSDASSYPVTPLAAFGLSDAFDNWDAINAQNLDQPVQACAHAKACRHETLGMARLMVVAWSTFGPHPIGCERFATVSNGLQRHVVRAGHRCNPGETSLGQNPDKDEGAGQVQPGPQHRVDLRKRSCVTCGSRSLLRVARAQRSWNILWPGDAWSHGVCPQVDVAVRTGGE
jgi:hypothetical protein